MFPKFVCIAFVVLLTISKAYESEAVIDDVIEIVKLGKEVGTTLLETWEIVEQRTGDDGVEMPFRKKREKKILNRLNEVSRQIAAFEDDVSDECRQIQVKRFSFSSVYFAHVDRCVCVMCVRGCVIEFALAIHRLTHIQVFFLCFGFRSDIFS